jgi:hypothetical protein
MYLTALDELAEKENEAINIYPENLKDCLGLQMLAWLALMLLAGGRVACADSRPRIHALVAAGPIVGNNVTDAGASRLRGVALVGSVSGDGKKISVGSDVLITSDLSLSGCCSTKLSALAPYVGFHASSDFEVRLGEYILNQRTDFPGNTVVSTLGSRVVGPFATAEYSMTSGATGISLEISAAPRLVGNITAVTRIPGAIFYSSAGEHGHLVSLRLFTASQHKRFSLAFGLQAIDYSAYLDQTGMLTDRNIGVVPFIGIAVRSQK